MQVFLNVLKKDPREEKDLRPRGQDLCQLRRHRWQRMRRQAFCMRPVRRRVLLQQGLPAVRLEGQPQKVLHRQGGPGPAARGSVDGFQGSSVQRRGLLHLFGPGCSGVGYNPAVRPRVSRRVRGGIAEVQVEAIVPLVPRPAASGPRETARGRYLTLLRD